MARAIGLGGVFIHLNGNSKALFDWYEQFLGLEFSAYGTGFLSGEQLMTITFKRDANPHMPLLNFRVDDIEAIMDKLKAASITILQDISDYPYGRFATFMDPFNNPIELWEAKPAMYKTLVEEEIKKYQTNKTPKV